MGVMPLSKAMDLAREEELDLVEIAPGVNPPVCKIIDFKKFKYLESKKERDAKKHGHTIELKELRFRPFISEHDLNTRLHKAKEFLHDGDRIKITVRFSGREMAHPEFGHQLIARIARELEEAGKQESPTKFEGRQLIGYFMPIKDKPETK